jgi:hypothetical protein
MLAVSGSLQSSADCVGEIRGIFKPVRLTASFPNIIYLLVFDRRRVEQAQSGGIDGRDYRDRRPDRRQHPPLSRSTPRCSRWAVH